MATNIGDDRDTAHHAVRGGRNATPQPPTGVTEWSIRVAQGGANGACAIICQIREFDGLGNPVRDYDFDHQHGGLQLHVHDFTPRFNQPGFFRSNRPYRMHHTQLPRELLPIIRVHFGGVI